MHAISEYANVDRSEGTDEGLVVLGVSTNDQSFNVQVDVIRTDLRIIDL